MNGREAVKVLMDGKKVHCPDTDEVLWFDGSVLQAEKSQRGEWTLESVAEFSGDSDWNLYEEPLTDEMLATEWLEAAERMGQGRFPYDCARADQLRVCARQLRERKL